MTLRELKEIVNALPNTAQLLVDTGTYVDDLNTVSIDYHTDGRTHIILSNKE